MPGAARLSAPDLQELLRLLIRLVQVQVQGLVVVVVVALCWRHGKACQRRRWPDSTAAAASWHRETDRLKDINEYIQIKSLEEKRLPEDVQHRRRTQPSWPTHQRADVW